MFHVYIHSWLNTWLQWIAQRQLQDDMRNVSVFGHGAFYIKDLMAHCTGLVTPLNVTNCMFRSHCITLVKLKLYNAFREKHIVSWQFLWWCFIANLCGFKWCGYFIVRFTPNNSRVILRMQSEIRAKTTMFLKQLERLFLRYSQWLDNLWRLSKLLEQCSS